LLRAVVAAAQAAVAVALEVFVPEPL